MKRLPIPGFEAYTFDGATVRRGSTVKKGILRPRTHQLVYQLWKAGRRSQVSLALIVELTTGEDVRDFCKGSRCPNAKLTETDIPVIRSMSAKGHSSRAIAAHVGKVDSRSIRAVVAGITWKHA